MNAAEQLLTDVVAAIGTSLRASLKEVETHTKGNFKAYMAGEAVRKLIADVPAEAPNRETIIAIYQSFAAALSSQPEASPSVIPLLPPVQGKRQSRPTQAKHNDQDPSE